MCCDIRWLSRALQGVQETVSIGEGKEDRAVVFVCVCRHRERVVGQLVCPSGVCSDGDRVWASPVLATNHWSQSPGAVGVVTNGR